MITIEDYKDAIQVQDAVNISGIVHSWSKILEKMSSMPTKERNEHPINVLFADKVAVLTGAHADAKVFKAYDICEREAGL